MSEFRKRRRWVLAESAITAVAVVVAVLNLIDGGVTGFVMAMVWVCVQSISTTAAVRRMRRERSRLDLRQAHPPRRDQFQRDLERLNKLRSASPMVPLHKLTRVRDVRRWDSSSGGWIWSPSVRRVYPLHDVVEVLRAIMLGFCDGFIAISSFLVAVIGLVALAAVVGGAVAVAVGYLL